MDKTMNILLIVATVVARLLTAIPAGDVTELRAIRAELPADEHYTRGYVARTLAFTAKEDRAALFTEAIAALEAAVAKHPRSGDAHALLGSTYGASIGAFPDRAAELGQKSRLALQKAMELEPYNPRVHYLHGSSAFHRPPEYGGGAAVAEPFLRRAQALFESEPREKPWPNWGRYETHLLLGQVLEKQNRRADAREQYERALAIAPESEYVRKRLRNLR
jgi:cytochrome c-type biogenesis protein CcmH/NrfG